jgi:hypothetical protein
VEASSPDSLASIGPHPDGCPSAAAPAAGLACSCCQLPFLLACVFGTLLSQSSQAHVSVTSAQVLHPCEGRWGGGKAAEPQSQ